MAREGARKCPRMHVAGDWITESMDGWIIGWWHRCFWLA